MRYGELGLYEQPLMRLVDIVKKVGVKYSTVFHILKRYTMKEGVLEEFPYENVNSVPQL